MIGRRYLLKQGALSPVRLDGADLIVILSRIGAGAGDERNRGGIPAVARVCVDSHFEGRCRGRYEGNNGG